MQQIDSTSHSVPYGMINIDYRTLAQGTFTRTEQQATKGSLEPNSGPVALENMLVDQAINSIVDCVLLVVR